MDQGHEPICPSCKKTADFRISNLYAGTIRKKDGSYKREVNDVLVCNLCGAVICQIDVKGVREGII
jgi:ribosomal protein L37AE/L43A